MLDGCDRRSERGRRRVSAVLGLRRGVVLLLLILASAWPTLAFRGHEHTDLGNDALAMALAYLQTQDRYWCNDERQDRCLDAEDLERLQKLLPGDDRITYGHVVAAVDHVVNPIKFIERQGIVACYPSDADQLYAKHVLGQSQLLAWRASHVNDMHFQGEGMASFWFWHDSAIKAAAAGECLPRPGMHLDEIPDTDQEVDTLIGALVVNAIGEHFLQDHFAPGHLFTFRDTLGDYSSLSTHDRYNVLGAVYEVDPERWEGELKPLITDEGIATQQHLDSASIDAAIAAIETNYRLGLWGDDFLRKSDTQRLYQVLLGARSIVDVIDAYTSGDWSNSFAYYEWRQMKIEDRELVMPKAGLPYGRYAELRRPNRHLPRGWVIHLGISGQGFVETSGESAFAGLTELEFSSGFSVPGRTLKNGEVEARIYEWDVAIGYAYLSGGDFRSHGPTARIIYGFPKFNMRFSGDVALRSVSGNGASDNRWAGGVRWELGFALAAMNIGIGTDTFVTTDGEVERSPTVRYGITFSLPTTRIPVIKKAARARLLKKRAKWLSEFEGPLPADEDEAPGTED